METEMLKVVLADDHVLVRDGIKALLEDEENIMVLDEASNGKEALQVIKKQQPDILIVDIRMPEMNGIEVVQAIKNESINVKTLVLSMHDSEEYVLQSIQAGADGYLLKGSSKEEFLKALHTIEGGDKYFAGELSSIIINNFVNGKTATPAKESKEAIAQEFSLTKRERQILGLVLEGKSNKEIGEELNISKRTSEVHRFNLMKKLDVKNLMELANKASEYNLM
ncbi:response regulator transcription factor [Leeuwenhoekiella marinoflava]|uniref:LuxR family two component transcriptional regulator n=2 Tax=Leeuwenhoekiella marinoflava TaxID=988 RepID=A0A4V1KSM3_9FLAO|nr:response regulator transcription factor [Leeuwenhoekiella marinoflava]RXG32238.1 LuxR family two component transcriptional regulator [Leeuwenhoekiella marinoflava]SHE82279.1 two component transcriptional regulator, LuxR family [Leeuwenhoekiella marinoflava DSM 3653]